VSAPASIFVACSSSPLAATAPIPMAPLPLELEGRRGGAELVSRGRVAMATSRRTAARCCGLWQSRDDPRRAVCAVLLYLQARRREPAERLLAYMAAAPARTAA
jgi:hypothetical protein